MNTLKSFLKTAYYLFAIAGFYVYINDVLILRMHSWNAQYLGIPTGAIWGWTEVIGLTALIIISIALITREAVKLVQTPKDLNTRSNYLYTN